MLPGDSISELQEERETLRGIIWRLRGSPFYILICRVFNDLITMILFIYVISNCNDNFQVNIQSGLPTICGKFVVLWKEGEATEGSMCMH